MMMTLYDFALHKAMQVHSNFVLCDIPAYKQSIAQHLPCLILKAVYHKLNTSDFFMFCYIVLLNAYDEKRLHLLIVCTIWDWVLDENFCTDWGSREDRMWKKHIDDGFV